MSMVSRVVVLCMGLLACSAQSVHAWRVTINGNDDSTDAANAVVVDAAGDVIAAGSIVNASRNVFVVKLAAVTGAELWRREIDGGGLGGPFAEDQANAVVVDATGDVLVGGAIDEEGSFGRFAVVKLAGATGEEVWRQKLGTSFGRVTAIAIDAAGDLVAVGRAGTPDVHVVKLAGATGAVLWRATSGAPGRIPARAARLRSTATATSSSPGRLPTSERMPTGWWPSCRA